MNEQKNVPIPDPSTLTTEALRRDISALRETLEARMDGREHVVDEKFKGVATQIQLLIATTSASINSQISDLKERLDRGDGKIVGQAYKDSSGDRTGAFVFAIIGALLGLSSLIFSIIIFATRQ